MKNTGKVFEKDFKESFETAYGGTPLWLYRFVDVASGFGGTSSTSIRFSLPNIADFLIYWKPYLFLVELKVSKNPSMTFEKDDINKKSGKNIKYRQMKTLSTVSESFDIGCYFILHFSKSGNTYVVEAQELFKWCQNSPKVSINEKDILSDLKYELLNSRLKRVNFEYDVESMINYMAKNQNDKK